MTTLFVDNTPLSTAAQLVAKYAGKAVKVVHVDDSVKSSDEFKSSSPNGEVFKIIGETLTCWTKVPVLSDGANKSVGYAAVAGFLLGQSDLLGAGAESKEVIMNEH